MKQGIHLLIADDHADFRKVLVRLLSLVPGIARVNQAANGCETLNNVSQEPYDVVLMDVQMPEVDGLQATLQIKAHWPQTKIIVLSVDPSYRDKAMAVGADRFITKDRIVPELEEILGEFFGDAVSA